MNVICTSECEKCKNCTLDESNKARIKIFCSVKERWYWFGQMIDCDDFTKIKGEKNEEEN